MKKLTTEFPGIVRGTSLIELEITCNYNVITGKNALKIHLTSCDSVVK